MPQELRRAAVAQIFGGEQLLISTTFGGHSTLNERRFESIIRRLAHWRHENVSNVGGHFWRKNRDDVSELRGLCRDPSELKLAFRLQKPYRGVGGPESRETNRNMTDVRRRG